MDMDVCAEFLLPGSSFGVVGYLSIFCLSSLLSGFFFLNLVDADCKFFRDAKQFHSHLLPPPFPFSSSPLPPLSLMICINVQIFL